MQKANERRKKE